MHVLAISYGKNLFDTENHERKRMAACAAEVESLHIVVFSRSNEGMTAVHDGPLHIHPSGGRSGIGMVMGALRKGRGILRKHHRAAWVITAQDPFEAGLVGWILAKAPKTLLNIQQHGDFFSLSYWRKERRSNVLRYYLAQLLLPKADSIRVVSLRIKRSIEALGVPEEKIHVLPIGLPLDQNLAVGRQARKGTAIPTILTVARLVREKNLTMLIDAFAQVCKDGVATQLRIVGSGPEEHRLRQHAQASGASESITFVPWTDTVHLEMANADVYALSSNYEGYARVLLEAMASGVAVVTTDVGCAGEVLLDNVHGLVVPVGDKDAFAYALKTLIQDKALRNKLAAAGVATAMEQQQSNSTYATAWARTLIHL